jgi:hypothetical protein
MAWGSRAAMLTQNATGLFIPETAARTGGDSFRSATALHMVAPALAASVGRGEGQGQRRDQGIKLHQEHCCNLHRQPDLVG